MNKSEEILGFMIISFLFFCCMFTIITLTRYWSGSLDIINTSKTKFVSHTNTELVFKTYSCVRTVGVK